MSAENNKALARRHYEETSKGNHKTAFDMISQDVIWHGFAPDTSFEAWEQAHMMFANAFPDMKLTIEDQIAEGDKVVTHWIFQGTHQGDLQGIPPTGKQVTASGVSIDHFADNKIVEHWIVFDQMGMMQQLGVVPAPGETEG